MAYEAPAYTVLEKEEAFELRQYEDHAVAKTMVDSTFERAGGIAFRRLAGYIGGNNQSGTKIAMTAPVDMREVEGRFEYLFYMPSPYDKTSLPSPNSDDVQIEIRSGGLFAAVSYTGSWAQDKYESQKARLLDWVRSKGWKTVETPVFARYNSPFTLWFMRRNEVLVRIERESD